jgi:hypothetical protein
VKETGDTHTDHIIHHTHHMHVVLSIHGRFQNVEHWRRQSAGCCIDGHTEGLLENNLGNAVTAGVSLTLTIAGVSLTTGGQARYRLLPPHYVCYRRNLAGAALTNSAGVSLTTGGQARYRRLPPHRVC